MKHWLRRLFGLLLIVVGGVLVCGVLIVAVPVLAIECIAGCVGMAGVDMVRD